MQQYKYGGITIKGISAEKAANVLYDIRERHSKDDVHVIVKEAKLTTHPFHNTIYADNEQIAAYKHRLEIARQIIKSIIVINEGIETRAFLNVMRNKDGELTMNGREAEESYYMDTDYCLKDEELSNYQLKRAKEEMKYFKKKYSNLVALKKVMDAIDELIAI